MDGVCIGLTSFVDVTFDKNSIHNLYRVQNSERDGRHLRHPPRSRGTCQSPTVSSVVLVERRVTRSPTAGSTDV